MKDVNQDQNRNKTQAGSQNPNEPKKTYQPDEIRKGSEKFGEKQDNQASREKREQNKEAFQHEQHRGDKNR